MNAAMFYDAAMRALAAATGRQPDADDVAMREADDESIFLWVDDLEDRAGLNVADFRGHIIAYCLERAGAWDDEETREICLREAQP